MSEHDLDDEVVDDLDDEVVDDVADEVADNVADESIGGSRRRPPTWLLAAGGVVAGVLLGLGAAALVAGDDDDSGSVSLAPVESLYPEDQATNAEALLQAWARHRTATYRAELTWSRELTNGQQLEVERTVVQQPPQRAVRQSGSTTIVGADGSLTCEPRADGTVCTQLPGVDYNLEVATELAAWRTAITGDNPAYAVDVSGDGCFELHLVQPLVDPPYGQLSQVCFDAATGAMSSRQVIGANATEIEQARAISPTVTEADWAAIRG